MELIFEIIILILLIIGTTIIFIGAIGLLKMPDIYLRMAASSIAATLGIFLILIACALYFRDFRIALHVLGVIIFLVLTSPVSIHLMARASYISKLPMWDKTLRDDLKGKYNKETNEFRSTDKAPVKNDELNNDV